MNIKSWPFELKITAALWILLLVYCLFVWIAMWLGQTQWMTENNASLPMAVFFGTTWLLAMQAISFNAFGGGLFAGILRATWDREFHEKIAPPSLSRGIPQSWRDEAGKRRREKGGHA